jgi:eukaryotic-like serine/threonine-protein kinase
VSVDPGVGNAQRLTAALAGRYRIERELGQGGMATVYLAEDLRHDRQVAIKVIRDEISAATGTERFLREIRLAARLNHPNILPLYDSGDADGQLFYVMPVAGGESLRARLDRDKSLSVADAVRVASEVAGALDYAHRNEVVHRDIKPENILLHEGHALITDFGIGKALSTAATGATLTQLGLAVGTPAYMSPEQAGGEPSLDGRSDLYSLGCVLYEMLAGEPAFTGPTVQSVIAKRFKEAPPDVTAARPSVPRAVGEVTRKLMAMEPVHRYATGAEAVEALTRSVTPMTGTAAYATAERRASRLPWVAVLPLVSRDPSLADFVEGLAEDITTGLSRFTHLQVVDRQSASQLAPGMDARRAGEALGARYLVEGSIRKSGTTIRLSAQLVDATTGTHLWAESFDRDLAGTSIFALQDELTDRIVATVADPFGMLIRAMARPLLEQPVEELTADELCVRLMAHNQQLSPQEHARMRRGFELALEREPNHSNGWAALATIYWGEQMHGLNPQPEPMARARKAAERAVQLDSANPYAWESLAEVQYFTGDLDAFRQSAERVVTLNPRCATSLAIVAMLTAYGGEWDRGYQLIRRAMALNPHHAEWFHFVPLHYHFKRGEYEQALAASKRISMPDYPWTYTTRAQVCAELGRWNEARAAVEEVNRRFPQLELATRLQMMGSGWLYDKDLEDREVAAWRKAVAGPPQGSVVAEAKLQSIAVLPFANMSPGAEDDWFADGITEEIINVLAQLEDLRVPGRTSCFAFKGKDEDLRAIGEKLGVQHVLEGSVRKAGSRVRITAQLINAADGYHLWSERYDRELTDIFAVQDELANAIAGKLKVSLLARGSDTPSGPRNVDAYQLMLKGRALLWQRGRAILDAIPVLEQSVALDPELAEAQALLGDALRTKWIYGMAPAKDTIPRALVALDRALALDPDQSQALATLANVRAVHDRNWAESLAISERVLAKHPLEIQTVCERAIWLALRHDTPAAVNDESVVQVRAARRADPLNSWAAALESMVLGAMGRLREAEPVAREAVALDPNAFTGRWGLFWILSALGQDEEALMTAREALAMSGRNPRVLAELAALHARRGEGSAVQEILAELRQRAAAGFIESSLLGCVAAAAGLLPEARELVARGIAEHESYFAFAKWYAWVPFRADPEGAAMLHAVGF